MRAQSRYGENEASQSVLHKENVGVRVIMKFYPPAGISIRSSGRGFGSPGFGSPGFGSPGFGSPGFGSPGFGSPALFMVRDKSSGKFKCSATSGSKREAKRL